MNEEQKETILFVDDEEDLLNIASEFFPQHGYSVITAKNGTEALAIMKETDIDCCITDINMPEMDGLELAEQIRRIDRTIPVIVVTGYPSMDKTIRTLKNGVVDFLVKPVALPQMLVCLQGVMRERELFIDNLFLKQEVEKKKALEKVTVELQQKVEDLQILTRIMEDFSMIRESSEVFRRLVNMTLNIAAADESRFYVANPSVEQPFEMTAAFSGGDNREVVRSEGDGTIRRNDVERLLMEVVGSGDKEPVILSGGNGGRKLPPDLETMIAIPLMIRDSIFGVLTAAYRPDAPEVTAKTLYYLSFMINRAAYAIENLALYENIYENLLATLDALVQAIEAKDFYTKEHSRQVTDIAIAIAQRMGLRSEEIDILEVAGPLHDIGKIGIPDHILLKPGRLTDEEYDIIKRHAVIGADIVGQLGLWEREQQIIRHHHERFDGSGYPDGLKGEGIPLLARILTVADVYDAMASNRVYRKKMEEEMVLATIYNGAGTQFDPVVVETFQNLYNAGAIVAG